MVKWRGIRWSVHPLFVLVMAASVLTGYFVELFTLFLIVIVHEAGHVLVARYFGWQIREVKLLPFGGVAEVEDAGSLPAGEDALVAIAGPLQNVWMGLAAWGLGQLGLWDSEWSAYVVNANMMIGLFNLLPIYPLDGGKLLQAALSYSLNFYSVMRWTARISLVLSGLMISVSLLGLLRPAGGIQMNLLVIGTFLFMTNWTYNRSIPYLFLRFLMHRDQVASRKIAQGVLASPILVDGRRSAVYAVRLLWRERYHLFYIMERGSSIARVAPEQRVVDRYLMERNPSRAIIDFFN
ncbi:M50 family metallopeptidase [Paenibacillus algorifonticola]|uniref:M50 family metallopeptidase n=1 Tax=Paenibacillus algorifonticola TaxID=684063 RepID=UPI003D2ADE68